MTIKPCILLIVIYSVCNAFETECVDTIETPSYGRANGRGIDAENEGYIIGITSWGIRNKTVSYPDTLGNFQWNATELE